MPDIRDYLSNLVKDEDPKNKYWILIFALYVVVLAAIVSRHEPWMDEAQAWLLARDASLWEIFFTYLRYEGSPGLWHLILSIPSKAGLPYRTLNLLAAGFSALAVWLFLRRSPFPPIIKILFPFSYFILFQYSVVARNYCLVAPLLFFIASVFKTRLERPIVFSLALALLANVSAHTFLIAGGIFAVHLLDVLGAWKTLGREARIKQAIAVLILVATAVFIVVTLWPAPDHFLGDANNWSFYNFLRVGRWSVSSAIVLDESSRYGWLQVWLSMFVFAATALWLRQKKLALFYLFPLFLTVALFAVRYWNLWHVGILFFLWIFALWIGFDEEKTSDSKPILSARFVSVMTALVLLVHIYWALSVVRQDFYQNYSAGRDVAEYIRENRLENEKIFASGWKTVAVQPYFDKNIFYNFNEGSDKRFWMWHDANQTPLGADRQIMNLIRLQSPDVLVFSSDHIDVTDIRHIQGYRFEGTFEGYLYWKTGFQELNFYWVFRKE